MDVPNRLAGIGASVEDDPVTVVRDAFLDCHFMGVSCDGGQQAVLGCGELGQICVVRPRDNEHVNRCLRIDIAECDRPLVTRHYGRRYLGGGYSAKQAVRHAEDLNVCQVRSAADIYGCSTANPTVHHPSGATASPVSGFRRSGTGIRGRCCEGIEMWVWGEVQILRQAGPMSKRRLYP
jgi:hypothetical protein